MINVPLTIESLVAILLLLTILYCVRLNGQLKRLKADEGAMRRTIAELVTATENAERAIAGLKATVKETEDTLGERLRAAEQFSADIVRYTEAGGEVLGRLAQIAGVHLARTGAPAPERRARSPIPRPSPRRRKRSPSAPARASRASRHEVAGRDQAHSGRADRGRLPVRAQGDGPLVRRRLYARPAAVARREHHGHHRAGGVRDATALAGLAARRRVGAAAGRALLGAGDVRLSGHYGLGRALESARHRGRHRLGRRDQGAREGA